MANIWRWVQKWVDQLATKYYTFLNPKQKFFVGLNEFSIGSLGIFPLNPNTI
jgi:hypothetical protein